MKIIRNFIQGKMNKDADERLLPNGVYRDALNVRISFADGNAGSAHKVKGTETWIDFDKPDPFTYLGSKVYKDEIYAFYLGAAGDTFLFEIDRTAKSSTLILQEDLSHTTTSFIDDIEIIENVDGDRYLYFNDKINDPKKVNITELKSDSSHYSAVSDMFIIKAPPDAEPALDSSTEGVGYEVQYKDQPQIAVQHIYEDGEESAISFYSKTLFDNKDEANAIDYLYVITDDPSDASDIYTSDDFGATYSHPLPTGSASSIITDYTINLYGNRMYLSEVDIATGYIWKSEDKGATWEAWGSTARAYQRVRCDTDGKTVYALTSGATAKLYKRTETDASWAEVDSASSSASDATELAVNEDGSVVYWTADNSKIRVSRDGGINFTEKNLPFTIGSATAAYRLLRCNALGNAVFIQDTFSAGPTNQLWMSTDYGSTWTDITNSTGTPMEGYAIDFTGLIIYNLYVSGGDEYVGVSTDGGESYTELCSVAVAGVVTDSDIRCTPDGAKGLVAIDATALNGFLFEDDGSVSSQSINGLGIELQWTLSTSQYKESFLKNKLKGFDVDVETGSEYVKKIRILYRNASSTNFYILDELDKDLLSIADDTTYTYTFDKSPFNRAIDEGTVKKLYDNVPHKANSMAAINNRLVFGGYTDGLTTDITPDITVSQQLPAGSTGLSMKSGSTQKYGILYFDEFNRSSAPLIDPDGSLITFDRAYEQSTPLRRARVTIGHLPPSWAVKYKLVRAKPIFDYRIITDIVDLKAVNDKVYFYIGDTEGNFEIGDALEAVSLKSGPIVEEDFFVYIEEVAYKEADFVEDIDSGYWAVITPPSTGAYTLNKVIYGGNSYPSTVFYLIKQSLTEVSSLYEEIPGTFDISGGYHQGNTQNQTGVQDAIIDLSDDGDVFWSSYPFHAEKYLVADNTPFNNLGRAITTSENFKQINRFASLCYSGVFVPDSGYNGLASFNLALTNYKDLSVGDGAINLIVSDDTDLIVLQEDLISKVLAGKDVLYTQAGEQLLSGTTKIMGAQVPYAGEYGCQNPESWARWGNQKWFADKKRGTVMRLSQDGLTPVSMYGMDDYFRDLFESADRIIGGYDPQLSEYIINDVDNAVTAGFAEKGNGWTTRYSFMPDGLVNDGFNMWGFKDGILYKHTTTSTYNNFYGTQYSSKLTFFINEEPDVIKVAHAMSQQGDEAWGVNSLKDRFRETSIAASRFEDKEGFWFAFIPGAVGAAGADVITDNVSTQGIGEAVAAITTTKLSVSGKLSPYQAAIGETLYVVSAAGVPTSGGAITGLTYNTSTDRTEIEYTTPVAFLVPGKFVIVQKNSYLEGDPPRDYYFELELESTGNADAELFSVGLEVKQSKQ